jgi:hypothetical protein
MSCGTPHGLKPSPSSRGGPGNVTISHSCAISAKTRAPISATVSASSSAALSTRTPGMIAHSRISSATLSTADVLNRLRPS